MFLFNVASTKNDIQVKMGEVPPHPEINKEYKVATVFGEDRDRDLGCLYAICNTKAIKVRSAAN